MATPVPNVPVFDAEDGTRYRRSVHGVIENMIEWRVEQDRRIEGVQGLLAEKTVRIQEIASIVNRLQTQADEEVAFNECPGCGGGTDAGISH